MKIDRTNRESGGVNAAALLCKLRVGVVLSPHVKGKLQPPEAQCNFWASGAIHACADRPPGTDPGDDGS